MLVKIGKEIYSNDKCKIENEDRTKGKRLKNFNLYLVFSVELTVIQY